jgi:UDP-glucose 4-epimerase
MKKILITGANSYIGVSFENYIKAHYPEQYAVDTVDMVDGSWRAKDFSEYDTVFHVAGIAHADTGHVSDERKAFYYKINTDLTVETAKKAKVDGVKQFIFMSSAIVYGESAPIGKSKVITKDTAPSPANFYGDSKLQAENGILPLQDENFNVVVLRPPMIYGKGSKGNYPVLSKFAKKLPAFPYVKNERSMLYVENLCEFVHLMLENEEHGIFHPQNGEYSNTAELVKIIAKAHGKKIFIIKGFGWALKIMSHMTGLVNKAFGSLSYDMGLSEYKQNYRVCGLMESIKRTESTVYSEESTQ